MGIETETVATRRAKGEFLRLPWAIYDGDRHWVPPLLGEMRRIIDARRNSYLRKGPHRLFLVRRDGHPAGRIMAGVDERLNAVKGLHEGWFSLFESVEITRWRGRSTRPAAT